MIQEANSASYLVSVPSYCSGSRLTQDSVISPPSESSRILRLNIQSPVHARNIPNSLCMGSK